MTDSPDIQGLTFEHLYSESMMLVVRPGHPLLAAPLGDLQRLAEFPLVLPLAGTTIRRHADSLFVQWGIPLAGQRLETLSPTLSRSYVLRSEAIWVAPRDAVRLDVGNGERPSWTWVSANRAVRSAVPQRGLAVATGGAMVQRGVARGGRRVALMKHNQMVMYRAG